MRKRIGVKGKRGKGVENMIGVKGKRGKGVEKNNRSQRKERRGS